MLSDHRIIIIWVALPIHRGRQPNITAAGTRASLDCQGTITRRATHTPSSTWRHPAVIESNSTRLCHNRRSTLSCHRCLLTLTCAANVTHTLTITSDTVISLELIDNSSQPAPRIAPAWAPRTAARTAPAVMVYQSVASSTTARATPHQHPQTAAVAAVHSNSSNAHKSITTTQDPTAAVTHLQ